MSSLEVVKVRTYCQTYRKILNVSTFWEAYIRGGLYSGRGLILGWHFVLVSEYEDLKIIVINRYYKQKDVSLGQNHLYFALKPI